MTLQRRGGARPGPNDRVPRPSLRAQNRPVHLLQPTIDVSLPGLRGARALVAA